MLTDTLLRWLRRIVGAAVVLALGWLAFVLVKPAPQDLPWTPLRLDAPIGVFTGAKLAALRDRPAACLALVRATGLRLSPVPAHGEAMCRVTDAVRVAPGQAMLSLSPAGVAPACPVAAGLFDWQWHVVQPAAQRIFGASVVRIEHFGSYSCRRMYGRAGGPWSEHAAAEAIDVGGFVLTDGTRISVARDWAADDRKGRFLHAVRDGACRLFSTVLSPDYNAAHHSHLHLDLAARGAWGGRACR
ncbi:MAG: extensin-like domain-containing protein [Sphingomonas sp.]